MTVLFADLRGFTRLSEQLEPSAVVGLLNDFYEAMVEAVFDQRGVVDKFAGDQVMALFGFPGADGQEPARALAAAGQMQVCFRALRLQWERRVGPAAAELGLGIGINSGEVVVGTVGSERRADFTAVGDAVNLAARLCGAARDGEIWVSESWRSRARELPTVASLLSQPGNSLQVKGKAEPVLAWIIRKEEATATTVPRSETG